MNALALVLAASQTFSVTVPAQSTIVTDAERAELPRCTTVINNGVLVLQMPDGSRFVDDAGVRPTVVVDPVPATRGAERVRQAYAADTARTVSIRISYATKQGRRTHADLTMPLRSASSMLTGGWVKNGGADTYLDGETLSLTVEGDAPVVRYSKGDVVRLRNGRRAPARWTLETPIGMDGQPRSTTSTVMIGNHYRRVQLEVSVSGR